MKKLSMDGNKRARAVLDLLDSYEKVLSTVLIGNTVVNVAASAIAAMLFVGFLGNIGVSISTAIMTVALLIFAEISPKTLAKESPEEFALFSVPLLRFFIFLFYPLNVIFIWWKVFILKMLKIKQNRSVTEDELLTYVTEIREEGGINEREEDMIHHAIAFDDLCAGDIITPRVDIKAVDLDDPVEDIEKLFYESGFSRLPVYQHSIDKICGVILSKDFFYEVINKRHSLASIIKPIVFVPSSIGVHKLLKKLQQKHSHMAAVIDEYGGTLGIVTIEDIMEELVGEIWDEHDKVVESIHKRDDSAYIVQGNTDLEDMFEALGIGKSETDTTVANWVMENIEGRPMEGKGFSYGAFSVEITKVFGHQVKEIKIYLRG